jgi:hypothetical protein
LHISNKSRTFAYRKREVFLIKSGAFQEQKVEPIKKLKIMNTSKMNELKETLNKAMELATELKN